MTDSIAVVATVLNEAGSLDRWLDSIRRQTLVPDEVVVVDGGSTDGTLEGLRRFAERWPVLTVLSAPGCNIAEGRNTAVAATEASVIAVTDAGTVLAPDWLEVLTAPIRDGGADLTGGWFAPDGTGLVERIIAVATRPHTCEVRAERFLPSSRCVAFRRTRWQAVGGYPEWLSHCEDLVFDLALLASGATIRFVPEAVVSWSARPTLRAFARQFFHYARGDGHAGLWPRRHALRYGSYAALLLSLVAAPRLRTPVVAAGVGYLAWRPYRRLWLERAFLGPTGLVAGFALVPVVAVVGDVAKMCGYVVGRAQRRRVRPAWFRVGAAVCNRPAGRPDAPRDDKESSCPSRS